MTTNDLIAAFETLADAPDGVKRLRELVLQLAVRGKIVPQDARDEQAGTLLSRIKAEREAVAERRGLRRQKSSLRRPGGNEDVPPGWEAISLGDIFDLEYGSSLPERSRSGAGGVAVMGSNGRVGEHDTALVEQSCIVVGRKGSAGAVNVVRTKSWPIDTAYFVRPYAGMSLEFSALMLTAARLDELDRATAIPGLNREDAYATRAALPPLAEQYRIVTRVDELMGLLDRLEAACTARDEVRRAARDAALAALRDAADTDAVEEAWGRIAKQMDALFTDPLDVGPLRNAVLGLAVRGRLVAQYSGDESAEALVDRIANERKGEKARKPLPSLDLSTLAVDIPERWTAVCLGQLVDRTDAGWSPKCDGHPTDSVDQWGVLKTTAIQTNRFLEEHHKALPTGLEPRPELEVVPGDLLITRAGPSFRVGVAAAVTRTRRRLMLSDKIIRCRFTPTRCDSSWLAIAINHGPGSVFLREKQTGMDQAQMNISQDRLLLVPVLVPPLAEQHRIVAKVNAVMAVCDDLEARLTIAREVQGQFAAAAVHLLDV